MSLVLRITSFSLKDLPSFQNTIKMNGVGWEKGLTVTRTRIRHRQVKSQGRGLGLPCLVLNIRLMTHIHRIQALYGRSDYVSRSKTKYIEPCVRPS